MASAACELGDVLVGLVHPDCRVRPLDTSQGLLVTSGHLFDVREEARESRGRVRLAGLLEQRERLPQRLLGWLELGSFRGHLPGALQ